MRYFEIVVSNPATGQVLVPNYNGQPGFSQIPPNGQTATYSSLNYGASVFDMGGSNPAAQLIELDIPVTFMHLPGVAMPHLKIHGVGLAEISQASDLNGMYISIFGGMAQGLPLANPQQASCLFTGQIWQSYGNWIGTDQTLDIYVSVISSPSSAQTTGLPATSSTLPAPNTGPRTSAPANIVFQWLPGQPLMTPLTQTLQNAYPQLGIRGAVHNGLVWTGATATGFFQSLKQLADYINQKSLSIISGYAPALYVSSTPQYPGVWMSVNNAGYIVIGDGTTQTQPRQIQVIDLIGQPTWSQPYTVQCTCVMRGDIECGDYVVLPDVPGITTADSNSQFFNPMGNINPYSTLKTGSIFTGTFMVTAVRHVGNSRNPDATSWVTTLDMTLQSTPQQVVAALPTQYEASNTYGFFTAA
jgi:hypothetical protein